MGILEKIVFQLNEINNVIINCKLIKKKAKIEYYQEFSTKNLELIATQFSKKEVDWSTNSDLILTLSHCQIKIKRRK